MNINQQMDSYLAEVGVGVHIERNEEIISREGFLEGSRHYNVTVSNQSGESFGTVYSQGPGIKKDPGVCDVLYAIVADYSLCGLPFEDFCAELGYDEDSRKAYKIWGQLIALNEEIANVLSDDEIDNISAILHGY